MLRTSSVESCCVQCWPIASQFGKDRHGYRPEVQPADAGEVGLQELIESFHMAVV